MESECWSELRPFWPFVEWSVPRRRMFVPDERSSESCFASTESAPTCRRPFASFTPLRTLRKPTTLQTTRRTTRTRSVTHVQRFHVHPFRRRRMTGRPFPDEPPERYVVRAGLSLGRSFVGSGTLPLVRPPLQTRYGFSPDAAIRRANGPPQR